MASISRSLPLSLVNKAMKGVCKLRRKDMMTTGFFIELATIKDIWLQLVVF